MSYHELFQKVKLRNETKEKKNTGLKEKKANHLLAKVIVESNFNTIC